MSVRRQAQPYLSAWETETRASTSACATPTRRSCCTGTTGRTGLLRGRTQAGWRRSCPHWCRRRWREGKARRRGRRRRSVRGRGLRCAPIAHGPNVQLHRGGSSLGAGHGHARRLRRPVVCVRTVGVPERPCQSSPREDQRAAGSHQSDFSPRATAEPDSARMHMTTSVRRKRYVHGAAAIDGAGRRVTQGSCSSPQQPVRVVRQLRRRPRRHGMPSSEIVVAVR